MLASRPLLLRDTGIDVTPLKAFIGERAYLHGIGKSVGTMMLFFTCCSPDDDFIYRDELQELDQELGGTLKLVKAFSRRDGSRKVYVQDRLRVLASENML